MPRDKHRDHHLVIRLSQKEKEKITTRAAEMGVSISSYIRLRLCKEQPDLVQLATQNYHKALEKFGYDKVSK